MPPIVSNQQVSRIDCGFLLTKKIHGVVFSQTRKSGGNKNAEEANLEDQTAVCLASAAENEIHFCPTLCTMHGGFRTFDKAR